MATYNAASADSFAIHDKTLVAATVDTVEFDTDFDEIEVSSDGAAAIYFTVDGSAPTVSGEKCHRVPPLAAARTVQVPGSGPTTVKLISSGTPKYSVQRP